MMWSDVGKQQASDYKSTSKQRTSILRFDGESVEDFSYTALCTRHKLQHSLSQNVGQLMRGVITHGCLACSWPSNAGSPEGWLQSFCCHWPTKYLKRGRASNGVQAHPRKLWKCYAKMAQSEATWGLTLIKACRQARCCHENPLRLRLLY